MIKKLILHNFQSHAHTEVDFTEGINSITGESDHGKTALQRAFQWVWKNTPSGLDFISHWATSINTGGNVVIEDTCYVTVVFFEDKYVTREKNEKGFNGYYTGTYLDGKFQREETYGKVGTKVPFPIIEMFNMEEVNIQNQHDSMFLLSESGQDVARFFNRLIKLTKGDTALAISESRKRGFKKLVTESENDIRETQESIDKLDWVDPAMIMVEKINLTSEKLEKLSDDVFDLDQMIVNIETAEENCKLPEYHEKAEMIIARIDAINEKSNNLDEKLYNLWVLESDILKLTVSVRDSVWIKDAKVFVKRIEGMSSEIFEKTKALINLEETISKINSCMSAVKGSKYSSKARIVMKRIDEIDLSIYSVAENIDEVDLMINKIKRLEDKIKTGQSSVTKMRKRLPETCPTCGQKLEKLS